MKAHLLDGPFAGEERPILGADGIEPHILVARCPCCDLVTAVVPGHETVEVLERESVIFVAYFVARIQSGEMARRRTVAYEVARDDPAQEQLAADVGKLVGV